MRFGIEAKIYRNTGTYASPTWNELTIFSDVAVGAAKEKVDGSTRGSGKVKAYKAGQLDISITGKCAVEDAHADFTALDDSWADSSSLDIMVLNGSSTTDGVQGYRFHAALYNWGEDQAMGALIFKDFELAPTVPAVEAEVPKRVKVASGAPAFTSLT